MSDKLFEVRIYGVRRWPCIWTLSLPITTG